MKTKFIETNGIRLFVVQEGPEDGPLILLLHGFPEYWYGWRHQIDFLAQQGYRVWAPDLRGYHLSERPKGVDNYKLDTLARDVIGLIDAAGAERARLVGHDWGSAIAWWTAFRQPDRVEQLVVLNAPHPKVLMDALRNSWSQRRKSWYMYFFRLPKAPEAMLRARNWRALEQALSGEARPDTFSAADMAQYHKAWRQPGALTAMLNYYRALFRHRPGLLLDPSIKVPTLIIWGAQDSVAPRELAIASARLCTDVQLVFREEATHWIHHEEPEQVNALIQHYLATGSVPHEMTTPIPVDASDEKVAATTAV